MEEGNLLQHLTMFFFPPTCRGCGTFVPEYDSLCSSCSIKLKPLVSIIIPVTQSVHMPVYAATAYDDPVKKMVTRKFARDTGAARQLGKLIAEMVALDPGTIDVIVPVPLHWTRYAWRGYNQAYEIARVLGKALDRPVVSLVRRQRKTSFQSRLSPLDRTTNVSDAFALKDASMWFGDIDAYRNKQILIVDDLCTTGATLKHVAKALLPLKPQKLQAVVACRAI